jgi:hypothetical protein
MLTIILLFRHAMTMIVGRIPTALRAKLVTKTGASVAFRNGSAIATLVNLVNLVACRSVVSGS